MLPVGVELFSKPPLVNLDFNVSFILTCVLCLIAGFLIILTKSLLNGWMVLSFCVLFISSTGDAIASVPVDVPSLSYVLNSLE